MPGTPLLLPKAPGLFDSLPEAPQLLPNSLRPVRPADWSGEGTYFQTSCASCVWFHRGIFLARGDARFSQPGTAWSIILPDAECVVLFHMSTGVSNLGSINTWRYDHLTANLP